MRRTAAAICIIALCAMPPGLTGCATLRTMPGYIRSENPKVFSGSRLDYYAATGDAAGLALFKVDPPDRPWTDLPFSLVLDALLLPLTFSIALYEYVFEN